MKKRILNLLLLIPIIVLLIGCKKNIVDCSYVYDDSKYGIGNISFEQQVEKISVDWLVGNIIIKPQDSNELIIREEKDTTLNDDYKFRYLLENNQVDVKFTKSFEELNYNFRIKNLYLFLPTTVKELSITSHNSTIKCDGVTLDKLIINGEKSSINIDSSNIQCLNISSKKEDIIIFNDKLKEVRIETESSNIGILVNPELTSLDIKTKAGNVSFYVSNNFDCNVYFKSDGAFKSKLNFKQDNDNYIFNQGTNSYSITSETGNLSIFEK